MAQPEPELLEKATASHQENADEDKPATPPQTEIPSVRVIQQNIGQNRIITSYVGAKLLEDLDRFDETVRGNNQLDEDIKIFIRGFIAEHKNNVTNILSRVPEADAPVTEAAATETQNWLQEYLSHLKQEAPSYIAPERLAKMTIPATVVAGTTAFGAIIAGAPGAFGGMAFGAWFTNKMGPDKAAKEIVNSAKSDSGSSDDTMDNAAQ